MTRELRQDERRADVYLRSQGLVGGDDPIGRLIDHHRATRELLLRKRGSIIQKTPGSIMGWLTQPLDRLDVAAIVVASVLAYKVVRWFL
jgi:hypothetical protein